MTNNEEILQKAKDHAAWKTCGWTSFREAVQQCDPVTLRQIMDEALRIAIQSAREEGKKEVCVYVAKAFLKVSEIDAFDMACQVGEKVCEMGHLTMKDINN